MNFRNPLLLALLVLSLISAAPTMASDGDANASGDDAWWEIPYPQSLDPAALPENQSWIAVDGNRLVDQSGNPVILRGFNIADPHKLHRDGRWNDEIFDAAKSWGANAVRIPIHPVSWRKNGPSWILARIDEAVHWANARDLYLIIDWHSIGNLDTELFQHPMYETTFSETMNFWRDVALRYRNIPTVAVYELFNEPTHNYIGVNPESLGRYDWNRWREMMEELIDLVRTYNPRAVPLVAGFDWAYDLREIAERPIRRENIAYASHPYPQKGGLTEPTQETFFAQWDRHWGFAAKEYPLILTEVGWATSTEPGAHVPVIHDDNTYGPSLMEYSDRHGISLIVWNLDPDWAPSVIKDWDYTPTTQGRFFKEALTSRSEER